MLIAFLYRWQHSYHTKITIQIIKLHLRMIKVFRMYLGLRRTLHRGKEQNRIVLYLAAFPIIFKCIIWLHFKCIKLIGGYQTVSKNKTLNHWA